MSGGAVVAAAAVAAAIKASGAIVRVEASEFRRLLGQNPEPLVVHAPGGVFARKHQYLMGYRGLVFHATSPDAVSMPPRCQVVESKKIWVP